MITFASLIVTTTAAILTAKLFSKAKEFKELHQHKNRYTTIDGLRGYLAISVFIHHFYITSAWKSGHAWTEPTEIYLKNLGSVPVSIFFLITGFLFINKILKNETQNWRALYISRIFRIYPLYTYTVLILSIFALTKNTEKIYLYQTLKDYFKFSTFLGHSLFNQTEIRNIIAQVDWTLRYEWLFYLSLPFIHLCIKKNKAATLTTILFASFILNVNPIYIPKIGINTEFLILFPIGGLISLYKDKIQLFIKNTIPPRTSSLIALTLITASIIFTEPLGILQIISITIFFSIILSGNDIFGILKRDFSLTLGEMSYSIYLTHGIVLYFTFTSPLSINLNTDWNLITLPLLSAVTVTTSAITFLFIESKGIKLGKRINRKHIPNI